ncbi:MAG: NAD(P)H-hydrate dehydratase [Bacillota bacterium]|nr:NAD(P)H-hydrate dehydratase [Bacillota bacterium]
MRLIGAKEQQAIDRAWQKHTGLPLILLMEAAAYAVVRHCNRLAADRGADTLPVLILCGRGQNGGDAYASARLLAAAGWSVNCRELFPDAILPEEAAANRKALINLGIPLATPQPEDFTSLRGGLIIDGIFGSGFDVSRTVPGIFRSVSQWTADAGQSDNQIIAIDVPSGLDSNSGLAVDCAIRADWTVTFIRPKIGLCSAPGRFIAGRLVIEPIGIEHDFVEHILKQEDQKPVYQITGAMVKPWCPYRPPDGHKGLFGRLLIAGGSVSMPGALVLAAEAAARSGTGLLQLAIPSEISPVIVSACPEALQLHLVQDDDLEKTIELALAVADCAVIGPGLGSPDLLADLLALVIAQARHLVIDADALNEISRRPDYYWRLLKKRIGSGDKGIPVLTPHPGEFHRLAPDLDVQDRLQAASGLAVRSGCIIVLKGAATIVSAPDGSCWINTTGQDGLARGGSGDVLAGLIGALLAQGLTALQAACAGVYFHGLAADLAAKQRGRRAMLPRDVIRQLGSAFHQAGWEVEDV